MRKPWPARREKKRLGIGAVKEVEGKPKRKKRIRKRKKK